MSGGSSDISSGSAEEPKGPADAGARILPLPASTDPSLQTFKQLLPVRIAWAATIVLVMVAILRVFYHDGTYTLTCLNAFTRYVYLPAYICFAYAMWKRRRFLAIINVGIVGCHLYWLAPDFIRDRRFDSPSVQTEKDVAATSRLRILFANVRYLNPEFGAFLSEIENANPDIVILVEFPWTWREPFLHSPVIAKYRYGHGYKPWRYEQVVVYSKLPLKAETERYMGGRSVESLDVELGTQTLKLVGLHAPRPMTFREDDYRGFWKEAEPLILTSSHPLIVVGDFNATQYSRVYEELKDSGLRSAHEDRGRGYATTWPNGMAPVPPIRIDQAFLSADVGCQAIEEGVGIGSDHKPLILDVEIAASR